MLHSTPFSLHPTPGGVILTLLLITTQGPRTVHQHKGEYCDTEVFRAECPEGEVILLEKARYGRMRIGRCVEIDLGYIGCSTDVIQTADRRCSGKRVCEIRIPDAEFESFRPCLKELKTYLEASYHCVRVETVTSDYCKLHDHLNVTSSPSGYIASIVTSDTPHCDGNSHPWVITAQRGQQVNLTLYDFGLDRVPGSHPTNRGSNNTRGVLVAPLTTLPPPASTVPCAQYGLIEDSEYDKPIPLCSANRRVHAIYRSRGHIVKIWATAGSAPTDLKRFVIHYSVIGCPDPFLPENVRFTRKSDRLGMMGCLHSTATSLIECSPDNTWRDLSVINCTLPSPATKTSVPARNAASAAETADDAAESVDGSPTMPYVLTFILLIGSAVIVFAVTLIVCIVRCQRHHQLKHSDTVALRKRQKNADAALSTATDANDIDKSCHLTNASNTTAVTEPLMGFRQQRHPVKVNGNDYEHIWQSTLLQQQQQQATSPNGALAPQVTCKTFKPDNQRPMASAAERRLYSPEGLALTDV